MYNILNFFFVSTMNTYKHQHQLSPKETHKTVRMVEFELKLWVAGNVALSGMTVILQLQIMNPKDFIHLERHAKLLCKNHKAVASCAAEAYEEFSKYPAHG